MRFADYSPARLNIVTQAISPVKRFYAGIKRLLVSGKHSCL